MPEPIVEIVISLDPPFQSHIAMSNNFPISGYIIHLTNGEAIHLKPTDPHIAFYAKILEELSKKKAFVYIEVDSNTGWINRLLFPQRASVRRIFDNPSGGVVIELSGSETLYFLNPENPKFELLLGKLKTAQRTLTEIIVTDTRYRHEIIHVKETESPFVLEPLPSPVAKRTVELNPVTQDCANWLFNFVNRSCDPRTVEPPCIPFLYLDSGCKARAHEMCRLMIEQRVIPGKVWIFCNPSHTPPYLQVKTRNHPCCEVRWGWHVSPTVQVIAGSTIEIQVIDPSIFSYPVRVSQWKERMGAIDLQEYHTDASVYLLTEEGCITPDPDYKDTNEVLDNCRSYLNFDCTNPDGYGFPPYECDC
jgi:hypothetical protein